MILRAISRKINSIKICAVFTAACFLVSTLGANLYAVALSNDVIVQQYNEIFNKVQSNINSEYGKITSVQDVGSDITVINIQDLHCHPQTQSNISKIIKEIDDSYKLSSIYMEGGYGNISTKWLTQISDKDLRTKIINKLLEDGVLTGAEYYVSTYDRADLLKGIDEEKLHKENIKRLSRIIDNQEKYKEILSKVSKEIKVLEKQYVNKRNQRFNQSISKYLSGKTDGKKFYRHLIKYVKDINANPQRYNNVVSIDIEEYPNISKFMLMAKGSQHVNINKVSTQLQTLINVLKNKIPYNVYTKLLKETNNFGDSQKTIELVFLLCQKENIDLEGQFGDLNEFLKVNRISADFNPVDLVYEERHLIEQIRMALSYDNKEYEITYLTDFEKYLADYLQYKLTENDWKYFSNGINKFREIYSKYAVVNRLSQIEKDFEEISKYYEINNNRNEIFVENMLSKEEMDEISKDKRYTQEILKQSKDVIIAVTGGFHSQTLQKLLAKQKVNTIVITPSIYTEVKEANEKYQEIIKEQNKILSQALAYTLASCAASDRQKDILLRAVSEYIGTENIEQLKQVFGEDINAEDIRKAAAQKVEENGESKVKQIIEEALQELVKVVPSRGFEQVVMPDIDAIMIMMAQRLFDMGIYFGKGAIFDIEESEYNGKDLKGIPAEVYSRMLPALQRALLKMEMPDTAVLPTQLLNHDDLSEKHDTLKNIQASYANVESIDEMLHLFDDNVREYINSFRYDYKEEMEILLSYYIEIGKKEYLNEVLSQFLAEYPEEIHLLLVDEYGVDKLMILVDSFYKVNGLQNNELMTLINCNKDVIELIFKNVEDISHVKEILKLIVKFDVNTKDSKSLRIATIVSYFGISEDLFKDLFNCNRVILQLIVDNISDKSIIKEFILNNNKTVNAMTLKRMFLRLFADLRILNIKNIAVENNYLALKIFSNQQFHDILSNSGIDYFVNGNLVIRYYAAIAVSRFIYDSVGEEINFDNLNDFANILREASNAYLEIFSAMNKVSLIDRTTMIIGLCNNEVNINSETEETYDRFNSEAVKEILKYIKGRKKQTDIRIFDRNKEADSSSKWLSSIKTFGINDRASHSKGYFFFRGHGNKDYLEVSDGRQNGKFNGKIIYSGTEQRYEIVAVEQLAESLIYASSREKNPVDLRNIVIDLSCCNSYYFARNLYRLLKENGVKTFPTILTAAGLETELGYTFNDAQRVNANTGNLHAGIISGLRAGGYKYITLDNLTLDIIAKMEPQMTSSNITMFSSFLDGNVLDKISAYKEKIKKLYGVNLQQRHNKLVTSSAKDAIYSDNADVSSLTAKDVKVLPETVVEASIFSLLKDKSKTFNVLDKTAPVWEEAVFRAIPAIITLINPVIGIPLFLIMQPLFVFSHTIVSWITDKDSGGKSLSQAAKEDFKNLSVPTILLSIPYIVSMSFPVISPILSTGLSIFSHYLYNKIQKNKNKQLSIFKEDEISKHIAEIWARIEITRQEFADFERIKTGETQDVTPETLQKKSQLLDRIIPLKDKLEDMGIDTSKIEQTIDKLNSLEPQLKIVDEYLQEIEYLRYQIGSERGVIAERHTRLLKKVEADFLLLLENEFTVLLAQLYEDKVTQAHVLDVARYANIIYENMLAKDIPNSMYFRYNLIISAALHDIGKNLIPVEILTKPYALTPEEYAIMKLHVLLGGLVLEGSAFDDFVSAAKEHHFKYDGKGYTYTTEAEHLLSGKTVDKEVVEKIAAENEARKISIESFIIAVADVYDAITSKRSYKKPNPSSLAFSEIVGREQKEVLESVKSLQGFGIAAQEELPFNVNVINGFINAYFSNQLDTVHPQLTMSRLKKLLDLFPFKRDVKIKIVSVIEAPVIILGMFFPSIEKWFLKQHKVSDEDRESLKYSLQSITERTKNVWYSSFDAAKQSFKFPIIKYIVAFCIAVFKSLKVNIESHSRFNRVAYIYGSFKTLSNMDITYNDVFANSNLTSGEEKKITNDILTLEDKFFNVPSKPYYYNKDKSVLLIKTFALLETLFLSAGGNRFYITSIINNEQDLARINSLLHDLLNVDIYSVETEYNMLGLKIFQSDIFNEIIDSYKLEYISDVREKYYISLAVARYIAESLNGKELNYDKFNEIVEVATNVYLDIVVSQQNKVVLDKNTRVISLAAQSDQNMKFEATGMKKLLEILHIPDDSENVTLIDANFESGVKAKKIFLDAISNLQPDGNKVFITFDGHGFQGSLILTYLESISVDDIALALLNASRNGVNLNDITINLSSCYSWYFARDVYKMLDSAFDRLAKRGKKIERSYPVIWAAAGHETKYGYNDYYTDVKFAELGTQDGSNIPNFIIKKIEMGNEWRSLISKLYSSFGKTNLILKDIMETIPNSRYSNSTLFVSDKNTKKISSLGKEQIVELNKKQEYKTVNDNVKLGLLNKILAIFVSINKIMNRLLGYENNVKSDFMPNPDRVFTGYFELSIFSPLKDRNKIFSVLSKTAPIWEEAVFRAIPAIITLINPVIGIPLFLIMQPLFVFSHTIVSWITDKDSGGKSLSQAAKEDFKNLSVPTILLSIPYIVSMSFPVISPILSTGLSIFSHYLYNKIQKNKNKQLKILGEQSEKLSVQYFSQKEITKLIRKVNPQRYGKKQNIIILSDVLPSLFESQIELEVAYGQIQTKQANKAAFLQFNGTQWNLIYTNDGYYDNCRQGNIDFERMISIMGTLSDYEKKVSLDTDREPLKVLEDHPEYVILILNTIHKVYPSYLKAGASLRDIVRFIQNVGKNKSRSSGAVGLIKGHFVEEIVAYNENNDDDDITIQINTNPSQEGYDIVEDESGLKVQIKAVNSPSNIINALEREPNVPILVTADVAEQFKGHPLVYSSNISNSEMNKLVVYLFNILQEVNPDAISDISVFEVDPYRVIDFLKNATGENLQIISSAQDNCLLELNFSDIKSFMGVEALVTTSDGQIHEISIMTNRIDLNIGHGEKYPFPIGDVGFISRELGIRIEVDKENQKIRIIKSDSFEEGTKIELLNLESFNLEKEKNNVNFDQDEIDAIYSDTSTDDFVDIYLDDNVENVSEQIKNAAEANKLIVLHFYRNGVITSDLTSAEKFYMYKKTVSLIYKYSLSKIFPKMAEKENGITKFDSNFFFVEMLKNALVHGNLGDLEAPIAMYIKLNDNEELEKLSIYNLMNETEITPEKKTLSVAALLTGDHKAFEIMRNNPLRDYSSKAVNINGVEFYKATSELFSEASQSGLRWESKYFNRTPQEEMDDFWGTFQTKSTVEKLYDKGVKKYLNKHLKDTDKTQEELTEAELNEIKEKAAKYRYTFSGLITGVSFEIFDLFSKDFIKAHDNMSFGMKIVVWVIRSLSIGIGLSAAVVSFSVFPLAGIVLPVIISSVFGISATLSSSFIMHLLWNIGAVVFNKKENLLQKETKQVADKVRDYLTINFGIDKSILSSIPDEVLLGIDERVEGNKVIRDFRKEFYNGDLTEKMRLPEEIKNVLIEAIKNPTSFGDSRHQKINDYINEPSITNDEMPRKNEVIKLFSRIYAYETWKQHIPENSNNIPIENFEIDLNGHKINFYRWVHICDGHSILTNGNELEPIIDKNQISSWEKNDRYYSSKAYEAAITLELLCDGDGQTVKKITEEYDVKILGDMTKYIKRINDKVYAYIEDTKTKELITCYIIDSSEYSKNQIFFIEKVLKFKDDNIISIKANQNNEIRGRENINYNDENFQTIIMMGSNFRENYIKGNFVRSVYPSEFLEFVTNILEQTGITYNVFKSITINYTKKDMDCIKEWVNSEIMTYNEALEFLELAKENRSVINILFKKKIITSDVSMEWNKLVQRDIEIAKQLIKEGVSSENVLKYIKFKTVERQYIGLLIVAENISLDSAKEYLKQNQNLFSLYDNQSLLSKSSDMDIIIDMLEKKFLNMLNLYYSKAEDFEIAFKSGDPDRLFSKMEETMKKLKGYLENNLEKDLGKKVSYEFFVNYIMTLNEEKNEILRNPDIPTINDLMRKFAQNPFKANSKNAAILPENLGMVNERLQKGQSALRVAFAIARQEIPDTLLPDFEARHTNEAGRQGAKQIREFLTKWLPLSERVSKVSIHLGKFVKNIIIGASVIKHVIIDYRYIKASGMEEAIKMFGKQTYIDEAGQVHIPPIMIVQDIEEAQKEYKEKLINTGIKIKGKSIYQIGEAGTLIYAAKGIETEAVSKALTESEIITQDIEKVMEEKGIRGIKIKAEAVVRQAGIGVRYEQGVTVIGEEEFKEKSAEYINGFVQSTMELKRSMSVMYSQKTIISLESITDIEKLKKALREGRARKVISKQQYKILGLTAEEITKLREDGIEIYIDTQTESGDYKDAGISGEIITDNYGKKAIKDYYSLETTELEEVGEEISMKELENKIVNSQKPVLIDIKVLEKKFKEERDITEVYRGLGALVGNIKLKTGIGEINQKDIEQIGYNIDISKLPMLPKNIEAEEFVKAGKEEMKEMLRLEGNEEMSIIMKGIKSKEIEERFIEVMKERILAKRELTKSYKEYGLKDKKLEILLGKMLVLQSDNIDKETVDIGDFSGSMQEIIEKIMSLTERGFKKEEIAVNTIIEMILVYGQEYKSKQITRVADNDNIKTYRAMLAAA